MKRSLLIVDDDRAIRKIIPSYFHSASDIEVVGVASNGREALDFLGSTPCDAVLSDIRMPDMNGIDLLEGIFRLNKIPVFVAITGLDHDELMMEVLARGGSGFVGKTERPEDVVSAVRDALDGGTGLSPTRVSRLVKISLDRPGLWKMKRSATVVLSEEEEAVLDLVLAGRSNQQIAGALHFAESTIKRKVSLLLRKFGVSSRAELCAVCAGSSSQSL